MKSHAKLFVGLLAGLTAAFAVQAADIPKAQPGWYPRLVDYNFVKQYATIPTRADVMIVDSRPLMRRYEIGHIAGAINIPDTDFDERVADLPKDKSTLLIFYCGGVDCPLSHASAFKAEKLGYTNVAVYPAGEPEWIAKGEIMAVSIEYVRKVVDGKVKALLVDSRPKARMYDKGHIPGAVSLPDSQFDELAATALPTDKSAQLIFYCGGYQCPLSQASAEKAVKLGYTNVLTFPAGQPAWEEKYPNQIKQSWLDLLIPRAAAAEVKIETGPDEDTIKVESFLKIVSEAPDSIRLIDVREPSEFAAGHIKSATNLPLKQLKAQLAALPADKPIVFVCATGARSGEAYDMAKMARADVKAYFLDAKLTYAADGTFKAAGK